MEITEGTIRITQRPEVSIGDIPVSSCSPALIEQTILQLVKKIDSQRRMIERQNKIITGETRATD